MNNCVVYKHTSPSGRAYIGVTNDYSKRCYEHQYDANIGSELAFHRAIRKYGWSNFTHEILAIDLTKQQALDMEVALINIADNSTLYNMTSGGEGCDGASQRRVKVANRANTTKGYYFHTASNRYCVTRSYLGKMLHFGSFKLEDDAILKSNYLFSLSDAELLVEYAKTLENKGGKGYSYIKKKKKFKVQLRINGKQTYFGNFKTEQEAIKMVTTIKLQQRNKELAGR